MTRARLIGRPARGVEAGGVEVLGQALRAGRDAALGLLTAPPRDAAGWRAAVAEAARTPRLPAAALEVLAQRQQALSGSARAVENARLLGDPAAGAVAVVTGQQPGLLGGPLLSFHKAAGAVALAARVSAATGMPVVPVFWLASEDHDLDEANQVTLLDRDGQPRQLSLPLKGDRRSLVDLDLPVAATEALEAELRALLPDTPRAHEAFELVVRRAGESFATWSARILATVLAETGLVILEPRELAPWLGSAFADLARHGPAITAAVRAVATELRGAGLAAPLEPRAEDLPWFGRAHARGPRSRLGLDPTGQVLRDGRPWGGGLEQLAQHLEAQPLLASPDVAGRVVLQNAILPVLAYLAGPTELAYHAQLSRAHRAVGRRFPLALPRPSAVWLDARSEESAGAFGRRLEEVLEGASPVRGAGDPEVTALLGEVGDLLAAQRRRADLLGAGGSGGGSGAAALRVALERLLQGWERARPAIEAAYETDAGVAAGRWTRLTNLLLPRSRPQERVLSILTPLARYGLSAVREGLEALDPLADGLWLLVADAPSVPPPPGAPTP